MKKPNNVYMGTLPPMWGANKKIKNITFSVTDECNLRCTYCYFKHKTHKNVMKLETAKKAVDDILTDPNCETFDGAIWEFIGGEPTIEMELIDKISDYILYKMYKLRHKWLYCYRFMIGTNGLLYTSEAFQQYIRKHHGNLSVAVTIDGSKEKHDLSRIKKDGSGSYEDVKKIIPLWKRQFNADSTKATFSHNDLPYLKESIINLWSLGIKCVAANIVFEDVWEPGDVEIFKEQLFGLADYIIENNLWDEYSVRFFDPIVGTPPTDILMRKNSCGTGRMLAINTNGDYYPCVRFMPSATTMNPFEKLGSVESKISSDRLRPFYLLNTKNQSSIKCLKCDIAGGCTWCSGFNFDNSTIGTLFERQTFVCEMHKANVAANKYLWRQYELKNHSISPHRYTKLTTLSNYNKYLYILCNSNFPSFCEYPKIADLTQEKRDACYMDKQMLERVTEFCEENNFVPIFCGCKDLPEDYYGYQMITYDSLLRGECALNDNYITQMIINVDQINEDTSLFGVKNLIVTFKSSQIDKAYDCINILCNKSRGLNINISITEIDNDIKEYIANYKTLLDDLLELIISNYKNNNYVSINTITNELFANTIRPCGAGYNSYTISPEGEFYLCAGFYKLFPDKSIGSIYTGVDKKYEAFCDPNNALLCNECDIRHCKRCILKNKCGTGEYNVPTELQCAISHIEYEYSTKLCEILNQSEISLPVQYNHNLRKTEYFDPMRKYVGDDYPSLDLDEFIRKLFE
jgi:radical SAM peptide maturase (CXXX-repeat target family)/CXXX repeat peptide maturase